MLNTVKEAFLCTRHDSYCMRRVICLHDCKQNAQSMLCEEIHTLWIVSKSSPTSMSVRSILISGAGRTRIRNLGPVAYYARQFLPETFFITPPGITTPPLIFSGWLASFRFDRSILVDTRTSGSGPNQLVNWEFWFSLEYVPTRLIAFFSSSSCWRFKRVVFISLSLQSRFSFWFKKTS